MKTINKYLSIFEDSMLVFGILSAAVVLFINVVLRNVFESSLVWAEEYAKFAIMWITFGGCGAAVRAKAHMRITALYDVIGPRGKKLLDIFTSLIGVLFAAFMVYYGIQLNITVIETAQVSPTMLLPMWIIYCSVPIGAVLMVLRFGLELIESFKSGGTEKEGN